MALEISRALKQQTWAPQKKGFCGKFSNNFLFLKQIQSSRSEGVFDGNISYFSLKPYDVTPRRDGLDEGSQHVFMQNKQKLCLIITKY